MSSPTLALAPCPTEEQLPRGYSPSTVLHLAFGPTADLQKPEIKAFFREQSHPICGWLVEWVMKYIDKECSGLRKVFPHPIDRQLASVATVLGQGEMGKVLEEHTDDIVGLLQNYDHAWEGFEKLPPVGFVYHLNDVLLNAIRDLGGDITVFSLNESDEKVSRAVGLLVRHDLIGYFSETLDDKLANIPPEELRTDFVTHLADDKLLGEAERFLLTKERIYDELKRLSHEHEREATQKLKEQLLQTAEKEVIGALHHDVGERLRKHLWKEWQATYKLSSFASPGFNFL